MLFLHFICNLCIFAAKEGVSVISIFVSGICIFVGFVFVSLIFTIFVDNCNLPAATVAAKEGVSRGAPSALNAFLYFSMFALVFLCLHYLYQY